MPQKELPTLTPEGRVNVYNVLTSACTHLWSKGTLQEDKIIPVLQDFVKLAKEDPLFMAHFTAWVMKQQSKDLKVVSIYANGLNAGDGLPFTETSDLRKPNLRMVSQILLQDLNPKLVMRVKELGMLKYSVPDILREGRHLPEVLRTAIKKYIRLREKNLGMMRGIKDTGLRTTMINLYTTMKIRPSDDAVSILRWEQKIPRDVQLEEALSFEGMSPIAIAKKIRKERIPVLRAIGALPKLTPVIAVALLEQAKGDEPVILSKLFEEQGILKDKEVRALYEEKVKSAQSYERTEKAAKAASEDLQKSLLTIKSDMKKEQFEQFKIGKIFMHIDRSGSMSNAIALAKQLGAIIGEMINEPEKNFRWGLFETSFKELNIPVEFTEAGFSQALFGVNAGGATNMLAGYNKSREWGSDVDIFISDAQHNTTNFPLALKHAHVKYSKPAAVVLVKVNGTETGDVRNFVNWFEEEGIPVKPLDHTTLKSSSLVMQAVKAAMRGRIAIVDEIMETPLPLKFPDWWYAV